jgi:hypothetical protein
MGSAPEGGMAFVKCKSCIAVVLNLQYHVVENGDSGKLSKQGTTRIARTRPIFICCCLLSLAEYMGSAASLTGENTGEDGEYESMGWRTKFL